ncbi:hypothetical protein POX_g08982 [Penicillium oxalicum]|uniref:Uncharacterized protein n=1 Tax=Penicillium oxalicum (strain 114-2 / CGMCC 5302) TaxID=933388 RepID=S7Z7Z8_PENO1|nr:hypothetical protein POX_g08982 [Penicillium oxalicum]EPS26715.1 hypothetical protein PDE_01653 [Penicillium oxalicum 114-2]KAI2786595.1 hypothetical protein POX_g08982 [Penicillium oxalicum]
MYKTNYELYSSRESLDSRRSPLPEELLSPLAELYPHVAALQPRYNPNTYTFIGYQDTEYWASAYTTRSEEESSQSSRRESSCRFVSKLSKLRRFLRRDDLAKRRRSEMSSSMN